MPKNQLKKHNSPTPRISYLGNPMPQKKALKDIAESNSRRRFPGNSVFLGASDDWLVRQQHAGILSGRRKNDTSWVVFGASIGEVNKFFQLNLAKEIAAARKQTTARKPFHLMEIGCGDGNVSLALSELPGIKVHATNLTHPSSKKADVKKRVDWRIVESVNIDKKFSPGSMNFIFSHFGLDHERFFKRALPKVLGLLPIGGRIIFNMTDPTPLIPPAGFIGLRQPIRSHNEERSVGGTVYYWERIK